MANVSNLNALKVLRAVPLRVYLNPTLNANGSVTLAAGGLDATAHPTAKDVGYTQGGLQFGRAPTFEDVPVDQSGESILLSMLSAPATLKFKGLQVRDYDIWSLILPATTLLTATGLTGISDQASQVVTPFSLVAIAQQPNNAAKNIYIVGYSGYNVAATGVDFSKKYNVTDIEMKLLDAGRADGKTWAIWEET